VVEQCRKLINTHQFNNEPHRILLASLASGLRSTDHFIASTLQKHVLREIKLMDIAVNNKEKLRWNPPGKRWVMATGGADKGADVDEDPDEDGLVDDATTVSGKEKENLASAIPDLPTKDNPFMLAMYGQICNAAKSYQSALC
jgi:general transcription factor 3C polypeptide 3 (transcription factor C subunit 4)